MVADEWVGLRDSGSLCCHAWLLSYVLVREKVFMLIQWSQSQKQECCSQGSQHPSSTALAMWPFTADLAESLSYTCDYFSFYARTQTVLTLLLHVPNVPPVNLTIRRMKGLYWLHRGVKRTVIGGEQQHPVGLGLIRSLLVSLLFRNQLSQMSDSWNWHTEFTNEKCGWIVCDMCRPADPQGEFLLLKLQTAHLSLKSSHHTCVMTHWLYFQGIYGDEEVCQTDRDQSFQATTPLNCTPSAHPVPRKYNVAMDCELWATSRFSIVMWVNWSEMRAFCISRLDNSGCSTLLDFFTMRDHFDTEEI